MRILPTLVLSLLCASPTFVSSEESGRSMERQTAMFGRFALADGELVAMDGGTHGVVGHTARILPDGTLCWERRVDSMGSDRRTGNGQIMLDAAERERLADWAASAWRLGDPAQPWPPRAPGATLAPPPVPPGVWAVLVRRGEAIRVVQGDTWTGSPGELAPLLDWLRTRVDAAVGEK